MLSNYPIYLKLKNNASYYKIIDSLNYQELKQLGSKTLVYNHKFNNYFDALYINDLKQSAEIKLINETEYIEKLNSIIF